MSALKESVRWIVEESCEDICKICTLYDEDAQSMALESDPNEDCCLFRRIFKEQGCIAGISEYFMLKATEREKINLSKNKELQE